LRSELVDREEGSYCEKPVATVRSVVATPRKSRLIELIGILRGREIAMPVPPRRAGA
jgi:hypothetical protein